MLATWPNTAICWPQPFERWKEKLDNPIRTPRQVLRSYVADLGISVSDLNTAMEWNCWDTDEDDEEDNYTTEE